MTYATYMVVAPMLLCNEFRLFNREPEGLWTAFRYVVDNPSSNRIRFEKQYSDRINMNRFVVICDEN
jgi:hypothetical protein